jgi:alpha,alpha-trehalase
MSKTAIAEHALLSDRHSSALVDRSGTVVWLGFPRFDSPTIFGRLLDDAAGHWTLQPRVDDPASVEVTRRYLERTLVLETTFRTAGGTVVLTDAMVLGTCNDVHALGKDAPHLLVRAVQCTEGSVDLDVDYAPRPEYGLVEPLLSSSGLAVTARGGAERLVLSTPFTLTAADGVAHGNRRLQSGDLLLFGLQHGTPATPARNWSQADLAAHLATTTAGWRAWSDAHQGYEGPWRDLVHQAGRVLFGLSYAPTGAVIAAATTSLPETVGGERNWDYRFAWVRDASFTMEALWVAACPDEAVDFFSFLTEAAAGGIGHGLDLQIMFGIGGEHDLTERTLPHLQGWRGSRPVRVGNGAWNQQQVDVYGELLGAAFRLREQLTGLDDDGRRFLAACADAATVRWRDRDQGIWEVRGEPRDFLYSKVMCWVALDRAIRMADLLGVDGPRIGRWATARDEIHQAVLTFGWSDEAKAFTQYFGGTELDASNLMLPIVGFLPADDRRILATIDAIDERLTDQNGLVFRYRTGTGVDGLAGDEGTFLLCTFWLAQALAMSGQPQRARAVFERAAGFANDLGLLAEEVDAGTGELLGNFPQAFSHIGLVNAAWAISQSQDNAAE